MEFLSLIAYSVSYSNRACDFLVQNEKVYQHLKNKYASPYLSH